VLVAGLLLTAAAGSIWIAYLTYGVGIGVAGACFFVPLVSAVGGWFEQQRTTALGIAVTGIGAGTLVMPPIVARLVEAHGFRGTCVILAIIAAIVLPLCALGAHRPPRRSEGTTARSLREIARSSGFMPLYLSCAALTCSVIMLYVVLVPYAQEYGLSSGQAALLVSLIGGTSVCGRLALAALGTRSDLFSLYRGCVAALALSLGALALSNGHLPALVACVVLFGAAQGGWVALTPAVTLRRYQAADAGRVLGTLYTGQGLGGFTGPVVAGLLIDRTGGYGAAILLAFAMALTAWLVLGGVSTKRYLALPSILKSGVQPRAAPERVGSAARRNVSVHCCRRE